MAPAARRIEEEMHGNARVLRVLGPLDLPGCTELAAGLAKFLLAGARRVVVDLSEITTFSSSAIGILAYYHARLKERGGRLAVVAQNPSVRGRIEGVGLAEAFGLCKSLEEALGLVRRQGTGLFRPVET